MTRDFDAEDEIVVKLVEDSGEAAVQPLAEADTDEEAGHTSPLMNDAPLILLYLNVLIIATCGLVYELLAGTLANNS